MPKGTKLKYLVKQGIKQTLMRVGRARPASAPTRILTYHSIGDRKHEMTVSEQDFEAQMHWLADQAPVITLEEAVQGLPGIAITFDDGFVDNLRYAAPVLARHGFPATVFMVAGLAGKLLADEPDPEHGRLMNWGELQQWRAQGLSVGAHTLTHQRLAQLSLEEQRREIVDSKDVLAQALGVSINAFAYPYGTARDYTRDTVALVQEAGFALAVSNRYGAVAADEFPFTVHRIWVDGSDSLAMFQAKVDGRLDGLCYLDSALGTRLRQRMNSWLKS